VSTVKLAGGPDYVRWVEPAREVWVTEPGKKQIEFFTLDGGKLVRKGAIDVPGGPESLVIDATRGRAYTHTWNDASVAIDIAKHKEVARWKNGCSSSRGIALDEKRGLLFVGCDEGKATVLDVVRDGKQLGSAGTGKGVDIIAYSPGLAHLYVPGGDSATLTILGVGAGGKLDVLGSVGVAADSHCVAVDDLGHAYVCDPKLGSLLVVLTAENIRRDLTVESIIGGSVIRPSIRSAQTSRGSLAGPSIRSVCGAIGWAAEPGDRCRGDACRARIPRGSRHGGSAERTGRQGRRHMQRPGTWCPTA